ncbi:hypothetical protein HFK18_13000|uniref:hypothetical protein n=1 Tax=Stenotrophomonas sp. SbOxS2 TaxID=2723885 RepID=UPI0015D147ED|nr:hypothetical protein [Stenotrophomonas sp. SbOxS2]NYT99399.1 hypothetical protein [Stenotrophomonas sp. SbOxS2]
MLVSQTMRIRILATTAASIDSSKALACQGSTLVVGHPNSVAAIGLEMGHARTPAQAMKLLKQNAQAFSEVIVFSDQIAAVPIGQIYIDSGNEIASVSSFEMICAMTHSAAISFETGAVYRISSDGRGQKEFLAALSQFLIMEESKAGSVANLLASNRTRRTHLLTQIHRIRDHLSSVMQEIYLDRLGIDEGRVISEQLKEIEKCARKDLLSCTAH